MSKKLNPKSKHKKTNINIVFRDINIFKNNSDPIPILLIFCFVLFIVFVFAIVAIFLFLGLRDRNVEETSNLTLQDFDFFVESINFFEEQNRESIFLLNKEQSSFPLSENFSFDFRDLLIFPHPHLAELTHSQSKMRHESKIDNFALEKSMEYEINSLDELMFNIPDLTVISDRSTSLQSSADRTTNLQEFFQSSRDRNESNISSELARFSPLANFSKNIAVKNLDTIDPPKIQLPKNTDEFSTHIAIANLPDHTFSPSWEKPPKKVPESTNILGLIMIFSLIILLVSRKQK